MTDVELAQLGALKECSFSPGSTAKAFIRKLRDLDPLHDLTDKQTISLDSLAHQYRRQIGRCMSESCFKCDDQVSIGYGAATGRIEHCQKCHRPHDVDEQGRVPQHRRVLGSVYEGGASSTSIADALCAKSGHPSREEIERRKEERAADAAKSVGDPDYAVALDAFLVGRNEYERRLPAWRKTALRVYNKQHSTTFARPYEYATKVAPWNRRAETRGDIYCRFCGERLFAGVKQPHKLVKESADAQRHLMICALQVLAGMRESVAPGYRAVPMEAEWSSEPVALPSADSGPLFGGGR